MTALRPPGRAALERLQSAGNVVDVVTVNTASIQRSDIVHVLGRDRQVLDMLALPGGRKRLIFAQGVTYLLEPHNPLPAYRAQPRTQNPAQS